MKVWILILAVSGLIVSSQACPPRHFSAVIVTSLDQTVEDPRIRVADPKLIFFKKALRLHEDELYYIFQDALHF